MTFPALKISLLIVDFFGFHLQACKKNLDDMCVCEKFIHSSAYSMFSACQVEKLERSL